MKTEIMDSGRIERTITRIAYQILEHCHHKDRIIIFGIEPRGVWVAGELESKLKRLNSPPIFTYSINVTQLAELENLTDEIAGQHVVVVDDVINSGQTMMLAVSAIMQHKPTHLFTACLVDRRHRKFPIHSDFTGLSLATTIQEHIKLVIDKNPMIYLE